MAHVCSSKVEVGVESTSIQGSQDMPELVPESEPGPSPKQKDQEPISPPSSSGAIIGLAVGTTMGSPKGTTDDPTSSITPDCPRVMWMPQTWIQHQGIVSHAQTWMIH